MGNHDWEDCHVAQNSSNERNSVLEAFEPTTIRMMQNENLALEHAGQRFWLVGFDSQVPSPRAWNQGFHRPDEAFEGVPADVPTILLAHEPDFFSKGDERVDLQISGHTHGGQLNLFGWRPMTPSRYGQSYAYGHIRNGERQMIVSGGIGFSGVPMRIGQAPELTFIKIRAKGEN
jgi:predicted MPP superfamily phosphohydrolase